MTTRLDTAARESVLDELRAADRFLLTTHESPDGDALGSLVAMRGGLESLGKDVVMFMSADEYPLPYEYRFLPLGDVVHSPPEDLEQRTIVFLDCANIDRMPVAFLQREEAHILNIDHHHDNTRFGTVDLVVEEACCTAELVYDLLRALGAEVSREMAEALYVGLVTDTGKFMYENTSVAAHEMAADLISSGVDVNQVYRRLYESQPLEKLRLLARALSKVERYDGGALVMTQLLREDYEAAGADDSFSEGIVDHIRAVEGTAVAALVREPENGKARFKVSLRATDRRVDVSAIARECGGGGHRQAAGFATDMQPAELIEFLRSRVAAQL